MGFSRFGLTMADKKIKVHLRVIRMIFSLIQRADNDRSVQRALPVYDNGIPRATSYSVNSHATVQSKHKQTKKTCLYERIPVDYGKTICDEAN